MSSIRLHWRLRRRVEPFTFGVVLDIFYVLRSIIRFVGHIVKDLTCILIPTSHANITSSSDIYF